MQRGQHKNQSNLIAASLAAVCGRRADRTAAVGRKKGFLKKILLPAHLSAD
jgi:hypothetical protein